LFVGFNALTTAEERLITHHVQQGFGEVYWDVDEYYVNDTEQEAGKFFRQYQEHRILGSTFPDNLPANFQKGFQSKDDSEGVAVGARSLKVFGAAQPVGQTKIMGQILKQQLDNGINPEETLIVLPDENLLLPVLHSVSGYVDKLNVTMGFPISATPVYNLAELLVELQINRHADEFNHRQALALLGHPYLMADDAGISNAKRKEILNQNWIYIPAGYLSSQTVLHRLIFNPQHINVVAYLREILTAIGNVKALTGFDREYLLHFIKLLNRISEIAGDAYNVSAERISSKEELKTHSKSLKSFLRLFRQLVQTHRIPFSGEPLKGLQVMGVLETRNLDFKNVFILSLNEGSFPSFGNKSSYIPFSIRRAYGLPTAEHQDAMYAYLFYRILQRAENVFLFYNTETDVLGQGESSRYLKQLMYESGINIQTKILHDPVQPRSIGQIVIEKDARVMETLARLSEGNAHFRGISPSALNTYIECRLRFYFRNVAKIKEPDTVEEDLDARVLGNFLHDVMENFYNSIIHSKNSNVIDPVDLQDAETRVDKLIDKVFIKSYDLRPDKEVVYEGQRLVVREIVKRFAHRIVDMDRAYAPFNIELLEQGGLDYTVRINHPPGIVRLSGKIDRVDRKGDIVRIIDYKTGKDKLDIEDVASLFARSNKRNKAAFQTFLYTLLYKANAKQPSDKVVPGLINRINLFDQDFRFGFKMNKRYIDNVEPLLPEFEENLQQLLEELYDPNVPFDQTTETDACKFCPYQKICYR
jgi:CRISPR/Cas system-associated exonuclease Cas4 (RecB family)